MIRNDTIYKKKYHPGLAGWQLELRYKVTGSSLKYVYVVCLDGEDNYQYKITRKEFDNYLEPVKE